MKEVEQLKNRGIVRELNYQEKGVFSQPIIVAKPGSEAVRITLDRKRVNKVFETWTTAIKPVKTMLADSNPNDEYFSILDLKDGYFNILIDPQLGRYYCFALGNKRFSFTRLVQGFNCSPMLFHAIIGRVLEWEKQQDADLMADHYVDDFKIAASTVWEHNKRVMAVVKVLDIFGFKLKVQKIQLLELQVTFLGHQVSGRYGLQGYMDQVKERLPQIEGKQTLQKALGLMNFLKTRTMHHASKLKDFYNLAAGVQRKRNWKEISIKFQAVVQEILEQNMDLAIVHPTEEMELYTD